MQKTKGSVSIMILILGTTFAVMIGGLAVFASLEYSNVRRSESLYNALAVAEAGVEYYRWLLAHDPDDFWDGTCDPGPCEAGPYEHEFVDEYTGLAGTFSLEVTPPEEGSRIVTIKSTGWSNDHPGVKRQVAVRLGPEPLTRFSFLHNANVWFGQGIIVDGEVFSNGGIRMDGENTSKVRTSKETYVCGSETGCWPTETKPGIWGKGGPEELWEFPASFYDFESIVTDFAQMKAAAQSEGVYLPTTSAYGYHLEFEEDGEVAIYRVTSARNHKGWSEEDGCVNLYQEIRSETLLGRYSLAENHIIYSEDTVWVDGVVNGKVSVVAARLPVESYSTDIWINGNLTYLEKTEEHSLGLIAQRDVIMALDVPKELEINAAMLAQNGRVIRHHYNYFQCSHSNMAIRNDLVIYGSVISNKKSYWTFSTPHGPTSGFVKREIIYNQDAGVIPPPYFPYTGKVRVLSWDEE